MALPIANLGYMPNLNTPSSPGVHMKGPNAWEQLATAVAQNLLSQGVQNATSRDYTTQAQQEGLAVDPQAKQASFLQKLLQGPTTGKEQFGQLRQEQSAQNIASTREQGETKRTRESIAANKENTLAQIGAQKEMQGKQLTSEEKRALDNIRSNENIAGNDRTSRERMNMDSNSTAITREKMGNEASTKNATIMANGMSGQAHIGDLYNKLQNSAQLQQFLHPDNPATPVSAEELQAFIQRFQSH